MAGSESHAMETAWQSYSPCRFLYAKVDAQCLERASAICHKMLEKHPGMGGKTDGRFHWEVKVKNQ